MGKWKEYKLGEITNMKNGKKRPQNNGVFPVYGGNGIMDYSDTYNAENAIIVGRVGAYCGCVYKCDGKCWVSDNAISVSAKEIVDTHFLYYLMTSLDFHYHHIGGAQPLMTQDIIGDFTVSIPSMSVQRQIVQILKSLDDKIAVNKQINDNLEQQAQALFKSWFVDFEPFRDQPFVESELGMIPEGWKVDSLSSIADYINGLAMQKYRPIEGEVGLPVLKIKELGQGNTDDSSELCSPSLIGEKYIIDDGDIIFSWSGTLIVKVWCGGKCGLNQHLFVVEPKDYPHWFAYQWTRHHLDNFIHIAKDKAVTMGHIKRGELDNAKVVVPDGTSMATIDSMMKPLHSQIISNKIESRHLASLRDTLLPRLMSGELSVDGLKGQSAVSPGQRPGTREHVSNEVAP